MGVVISPDSALGKELARWNTPRNRPVVDSSGEAVRDTDGSVIMGKGAIGFEPYPKMLYRAQINPQTGKPSVGEVPPHPAHFANPAEHERAQLWVESFNRSCQTVVRDEQSERIANGQGWAVTQTEALDRFEAQQQAIAQAAAEAAYAARSMSERARTELAEADAATDKHVVDVVPTRKHGKAAKGLVPVTAA